MSMYITIAFCVFLCLATPTNGHVFGKTGSNLSFNLKITNAPFLVFCERYIHPLTTGVSTPSFNSLQLDFPEGSSPGSEFVQA